MQELTSRQNTEIGSEAWLITQSRIRGRAPREPYELYDPVSEVESHRPRVGRRQGSYGANRSRSFPVRTKPRHHHAVS